MSNRNSHRLRAIQQRAPTAGLTQRTSEGGKVAESCYLRYPHIARGLIAFTADDDVWLAPLREAVDGRGTQAWRLTDDQVPVRHPRLNPSATHVAWTST